MKKFLMMFFVALAVGFQSCDNNDDLWDAIDDLKGRVQALETQVNALNGNVEALQQLYSGATISKVEELADKFVLTLTNGERIELAKGSQATAVIPVIGIDENGQWRYSVQEGVWISLGVKAEAEDGKTPQFRIDEKTGYWQVRYGDTEEYANVMDTNGQPVKAIGEGSVTDKFFEDARLDGDEFYVKLLDGTELRVPVVKDFFIRIVTATEGVQTFDAGATKRFVVESKGVVNTVVTAPEGWTAFLTDAGTELVVTAPDAAPASRASADTSKDVAVQATSAGGFSAIAKIEVASSGVAPVAPTLTVANSVTVEPTTSSLTFDVQTDGDSWYYLIQKTAEATTPDAATIAATGIAGAGSSVTVENLEANTAYTFHVVAVKQNEPVLYSEVQSVQNTTVEVVQNQTDYYQMYLDGENITLGSLTINRTAYPEAQIVKPAELTTAMLQAGGLIFIDNSDESALAQTISGTSLRVGQTAAGDGTVLIGRIRENAQAEFSMPELRCEKNVAMMNLHLKINSGVSYNFTTSNAVVDPALQIVDCTLETGRYMIYDVNPSRGFESVLVDNSIIKFPNRTDQPAVFMLPTTVKTGYPNQRIVLTNNVLYADAMLQAHLVQCGNNANFITRDLQIEILGNTIYNIYQPNVLTRAGMAKGIVMENNVGYVDYSGLAAATNPTYLMCVYDASANAGTSSVAGNYLYSLGMAGTGANVGKLVPWSLVHSNNKVTVNGRDDSTICNGDDEPSGYPFASADAAKGYFPINAGVVTNGAGASYDSKPWLKTE